MMGYTPKFPSIYEDYLGTWRTLHAWLLSIVRYWVIFSGVGCWKDQEEQVSEDIVQEALLRTFQYSQTTDIKSLKGFSRVTARHYFEDLRRKEYRYIRFSQLDELAVDQSATYEDILYDQDDPSEIAIDNILQEEVFSELADVIVAFPLKQRTALLVDLADNMVFDTQQTPLQSALLEVGICIQDYNRPIPQDPKERSRFASLRSLAYKKIKQSRVQDEYVPVP